MWVRTMTVDEFIADTEKRYGEYKVTVKYYLRGYLDAFTPQGLGVVNGWVGESWSATFGPPDIAAIEKILHEHHTSGPKGWPIPPPADFN